MAREQPYIVRGESRPAADEREQDRDGQDAASYEIAANLTHH